MNRTRHAPIRLLLVLGVVPLVAWAGVPAGATPTHVHVSFNVPISVTTQVDKSSSCDNTGPHITFKNFLLIGDHWLQFTFQNAGGNHVANAYAQAVLDLSQAGNNGNPFIPKQPPLGGVGGNPFIYFADMNGVMHYLGRCVQDFGSGYDNPNSRWTANGSTSGWADFTVSTFGCSNKGGSSLSFDGTNGEGGASGKLVLTNSFLGDGMPYPQHVNNSIAASVDLQFAPPWTGGIPKQPPLGGAGGNPEIFAATGNYSPWVNDGTYPDPGLFLGKCNQLGS
jgi:hypothetical protein